MPVELPPTYVYPDDATPVTYGLDTGWNDEVAGTPDYIRAIFAIQTAAEKMTLNGTAVWAAVSASNPIMVLDEVCKGLSGQDLITVRTQLAMHCYAAFTMAQNPEAIGVGPYKMEAERNNTLATFYGQFLTVNSINWTDSFQAHAVDFYGTPMMPVVAIGYWLFGGGQDRNVHIGSLNLTMVATDFTPITGILNNAANGAGTYQLQSAPFSYNTFNKAPLDLPAAGMIGRVSGNLSGVLNISADGGYSFSGSYTLNSDLYNADMSNRSWLQESLTTFLSSLGDAFGHTDYKINFLDSQSVEFTGNR